MCPNELHSLAQSLHGDSPPPAGHLSQGPHDQKRGEHCHPRYGVHRVTKRCSTTSEEDAGEGWTDDGCQVTLYPAQRKGIGQVATRNKVWNDCSPRRLLERAE